MFVLENAKEEPKGGLCNSLPMSMINIWLFIQFIFTTQTSFLPLYVFSIWKARIYPRNINIMFMLGSGDPELNK